MEHGQNLIPASVCRGYAEIANLFNIGIKLPFFLFLEYMREKDSGEKPKENRKVKRVFIQQLQSHGLFLYFEYR